MRLKPRRIRTRRSVIPWRRLLGLLLLVGLIGAGVWVYENRTQFQGVVLRVAERLQRDLEAQAATLAAPPPTPTRDPTRFLVEGDNFWALGSAGEAVQSYLQVLPSLPNDVKVHYRVTLGLLSLGNAREALPYAEKTVTANPYASEAWTIRAWALTDNRQTGQAIASAMRARELNPNNLQADVQLARAYFAQGQTNRARNLIDSVLGKDSNLAEAYWVRGQIREEGLFEFTGALEDYRLAYDIAREEKPVLAGLIAIDIAQMEIRNQDYAAAIRTLDSVLRVNPENTLALYWIGLTYFSYQGDPNQAASYLQRCVDVNPNSYDCFYLLGRAQFALNDYTQAANSFQRAIDLGTPFARHYWWAANAQFALGDCARAGGFLREGVLRLEGAPQDLYDAYEYLVNICQLNIVVRRAPVVTNENAAGD